MNVVNVDSDEIVSDFKKEYLSELGKKISKEDINFIKIENDFSKEVSRLFFELGSDEKGKSEKVVFLGRDHSLTYKTTKAFLKYCNKNDEEPMLLIFDAHPDCKLEEKVGEVDRFNWLRCLIKDGFPTERIILVGLRALDVEEKSFLEENNIRRYNMGDLNDYQEMCDILMELSNKFWLYISVDIDVVDAAFVPGTIKPEVGGLTSRQLIYFLQRLNILKNLKAIDLMEVDPEKDINLISVKLASKILGEIL